MRSIRLVTQDGMEHEVAVTDEAAGARVLLGWDTPYDLRVFVRGVPSPDRDYFIEAEFVTFLRRSDLPPRRS